MMPLQEQKQVLREEITLRIKKMTRAERQKESTHICTHLHTLLPSTPCIIAAFTPFSTEPDITPLLHTLEQEHFAIYFPTWKNGRLQFFRNSRALQPQELAYAFIPGRAFDNAGNRLGRGKGMYDRWLHEQRATNKRTTCIGIAFSCQLVQKVPMEAHDQFVDTIVHGSIDLPLTSRTLTL